MRKLILFVTVLFASSAFAQMDNLINLSAEWMRTGARNGATNSTDIVVYNPAGLTNLESGLHINLSNQSLFRKPSHSYDLGFGDGLRSFSQSGSDLFIPALYLAYNMKQWSFFGAGYISGGGATMNYPKGSLTTDLIALSALQSAGGAYMSAMNQSLKASSMYLTFMGGAAYAVHDKVSFSVGIRSIMAENSAEGGMTLSSSPLDLPDMPLSIDFEESASGIGAVVGINFSISEKMNLSARYESAVSLNLVTKQNIDDFGLTVDGQKNRRDLPAMAAIGIGFKPGPAITTYLDFNYYFQKQANWGNSTDATNQKSYASLAGNAYTLGAGIEFMLTKKFMASFGGGFTNYLYGDRDGYYTKLGTFEVMQDDNVNINTGFSFQATEKIRINAGYMHTFWKKDQNIKALIAQPLDVDVNVNNSLNAIALGIELSF